MSKKITSAAAQYLTTNKGDEIQLDGTVRPWDYNQTNTNRLTGESYERAGRDGFCYEGTASNSTFTFGGSYSLTTVLADRDLGAGWVSDVDLTSTLTGRVLPLASGVKYKNIRSYNSATTIDANLTSKHNCEEESGTIGYNVLSSTDYATLGSGVTHTQDDTVTYSDANDRGYAGAGGLDLLSFSSVLTKVAAQITINGLEVIFGSSTPVTATVDTTFFAGSPTFSMTQGDSFTIKIRVTDYVSGDLTVIAGKTNGIGVFGITGVGDYEFTAIYGVSGGGTYDAGTITIYTNSSLSFEGTIELLEISYNNVVPLLQDGTTPANSSIPKAQYIGEYKPKLKVEASPCFTASTGGCRIFKSPLNSNRVFDAGKYSFLSCWFNIPSVGNQTLLFSHGTSEAVLGLYSIEMNTSGHLIFRVNNGLGGTTNLDTTIAVNYADSNWHRISVKIDKSTVVASTITGSVIYTFYIDGVEVGTRTVAVGASYSSINIHEGMHGLFFSSNGSACGWYLYLSATDIFDSEFIENDAIGVLQNGWVLAAPLAENAGTVINILSNDLINNPTPSQEVASPSGIQWNTKQNVYAFLQKYGGNRYGVFINSTFISDLEVFSLGSSAGSNSTVTWEGGIIGGRVGTMKISVVDASLTTASAIRTSVPYSSLEGLVGNLSTSDGIAGFGVKITFDIYNPSVNGLTTIVQSTYAGSGITKTFAISGTDAWESKEVLMNWNATNNNIQIGFIFGFTSGVNSNGDAVYIDNFKIESLSLIPAKLNSDGSSQSVDVKGQTIPSAHLSGRVLREGFGNVINLNPEGLPSLIQRNITRDLTRAIQSENSHWLQNRDEARRVFNNYVYFDDRSKDQPCYTVPASGFLIKPNATIVVSGAYQMFGFWFKKDSLPLSTGFILYAADNSNLQNFSLYVTTSGYLGIEIRNWTGGNRNVLIGALTNTVNVCDGEWHFITCTVEIITPLVRSDLKFYVDGEQIDSYTVEDNDLSNNPFSQQLQVQTLFSNNGGTQSLPNASMFGLGFWSSETENFSNIQSELYRNQFAVKPSFYFPFMENARNRINEVIANTNFISNTATVAGSEWTANTQDVYDFGGDNGEKVFENLIDGSRELAYNFSSGTIDFTSGVNFTFTFTFKYYFIYGNTVDIILLTSGTTAGAYIKIEENRIIIEDNSLGTGNKWEQTDFLLDSNNQGKEIVLTFSYTHGATGSGNLLVTADGNTIYNKTANVKTSGGADSAFNGLTFLGSTLLRILNFIGVSAISFSGTESGSPKFNYPDIINSNTETVTGNYNITAKTINTLHLPSALDSNGKPTGLDVQGNTIDNVEQVINSQQTKALIKKSYRD